MQMLDSDRLQMPMVLPLSLPPLHLHLDLTMQGLRVEQWGSECAYNVRPGDSVHACSLCCRVACRACVLELSEIRHSLSEGVR